jgi:hypothetical protein
MILVEQNTHPALVLSPRTAVLDRGRIIYDSPSETLKRDPERLHRLIGGGLNLVLKRKGRITYTCAEYVLNTEVHHGESA